GMDPLSFLRYLKTLGEITAIVTLDRLPAFAEMDPESCYLGFEVAFRSEADRNTIEEVFEFVREDAQIRILPPGAPLADYVELIRALPEGEERGGELLVRCGTLGEAELEEALAPPPAPAAPEAAAAEAAASAAAAGRQAPAKAARAGKSIRVDADKLDELINLVGELVIAGAGASLVAARSGVSEMMEAT